MAVHQNKKSPSRRNMRVGLRLMRVELMNAARCECGFYPIIDAFGERRVGRFHRRQATHRGNDFIRSIRTIELRSGIEDLQRVFKGDPFVLMRSECR